MIRTHVLSLGIVSVLAAGSLLAGTNASPVSVTAPIRTVTAAAANTSPATREQAVDAMDAAVAAAVIGSVSSQFHAFDVQVQIDGMRVLPSSIQDRQVTGAGRLQIGGDAEWIPFQFAALYDTANTEVTHPKLTLGGAGATNVSPRSPVAKAFNGQISQALATEFSGQAVHWSLDHATSTGKGRFVRIEGGGTADFGADGRTRAHVEGMLDTTTGSWARVHYELGGGSEWATDSAAVASL